MTVTKIEKKGKNYLVTLNQETVELTEETMLFYRISKGKVISDSIDEIKEKNLYYLTYQKVIRKLKYPKSSHEIIKYLEKEKLDQKNINEMMKELKEKKLIDDHKLIENIITYTNQSRNKIKLKLLQKGFIESDFQDLLQKKDENIWLEKDFHKLVLKHQKESQAVAKIKIERSLLSKGYAYHHIKEIMNQINQYDFNPEAINKDYKKWYQKYQDEQKTIKKLLTLGYSYQEIKDTIKKHFTE
ncbi:MAG: hypothetical protein GX312_01200 [Candidatus Phytoplasma sp.]|nr:hypothetical protein [Phytoplasma sp.]